MSSGRSAIIVPANGRPPIVGVSEVLRRVVTLARDFATSDLPILIVGSTGTGKELLAQHIHHWSGRPGRLVDVNCAGLPRDLADGWLFGHRRNAFTGAGEASPGLIEDAADGTLFLDEVSSLPLEAQAKFLRVLETKEVRRVMDVRKRTVSFGVVAAAHEDLGVSVERGMFRRDLYQRLAGVVLRLPALAERTQDLLPLAVHFAAGQGRGLGAGVDAVLREYAWPGNVRELCAAVGRAVVLTRGESIDPAALAEAIALGAPHGGSRGTVHRDPGEERAVILGALRATGWRVGQAARSLGIHRVTLFRRARRLGVSLAPTDPRSVAGLR